MQGVTGQCNQLRALLNPLPTYVRTPTHLQQEAYCEALSTERPTKRRAPNEAEEDFEAVRDRFSTAVAGLKSGMGTEGAFWQGRAGVLIACQRNLTVEFEGHKFSRARSPVGPCPTSFSRGARTRPSWLHQRETPCTASAATTPWACRRLSRRSLCSTRGRTESAVPRACRWMRRRSPARR